MLPRMGAQRKSPGSCCRIVALLALVLLFASGCAGLGGRKELPRPWTDAMIEKERELRVTLVDDSVVDLRHARIEGEGEGAKLIGEDPLAAPTEVVLPLERIAMIEVERDDPRAVASVLLIFALILTVLAAFAPQSLDAPRA
jgi:hypothetical protein